MEQCQSRYEEMKRKSHYNEKIFSAQFITADCSKVELKHQLRDDVCKRWDVLTQVFVECLMSCRSSSSSSLFSGVVNASQPPLNQKTF